MEKKDEVLTGKVYKNTAEAELASYQEKTMPTGWDRLRNAFQAAYPPPPTPMYHAQQGYCDTDTAYQNFVMEKLLRDQQQCCCEMDRVQREYQQFQMNQMLNPARFL